MKQWIQAIIILPFNVLVIIPSVILYLKKYNYTAPAVLQTVLGVFLFVSGAVLAVWTMMLFHKTGKGTPAPWNSPKRLVVQGAYKIAPKPIV